jgi:hypothetical protein
MPTSLLIALGAGLISAVAFAAAAVGNPMLTGILFLLTPLPLFLCGFALGWQWAAVAGLTGALTLTVMGTPATGAFFGASTALPAALLTYLALLSRPVTASQDGTAALEWYPPGYLVLWIAGISALLSLLFIALLGGTTEALREKATPVIEGMVKSLPADVQGTPGLGEQDIPQIVDVAVMLMPAAAAVLPMLVMMFNLWFSGKVSHLSGQLARPWPDLAAMQFPAGAPLALLAAMFLSSVGGFTAMAGAAFSGTLLFAYVLMGLAIIHYVTRGAAWRSFALWALYAGMFIISGGVTLIVAVIGLLDAVFPLRRPRQGGHGPPGN